jgi:parallel beta-helix repeat protein
VTLTENVITGNYYNRILLASGAMMGHDTTLTPQAVWDGYELEGTLTIPPTFTLTIEAGTVIKVPGWPWYISLNVQGNLEAAGTPAQPITFTSTTGGSTWAGIQVDGGNAELAYATVEYACSSTTQSNVAVLNGGQLEMADSLVRECHFGGGAGEKSLFVDGGVAEIRGSTFESSDHHAIYVATAAQPIILTGNIVRDNLNGIYLGAGSQAVLVNNVIADNPAIGIRVAATARADMWHTTFVKGGTYGANPLPAGLYVDNGGAAVLTNTILSEVGTGVRVNGSGVVTMTNTLWDNNGTDIVGAVNETGHMEGLALFEDDGYHLTRYSAALGRGVEAGVIEDIDGEARPLPVGSAPDLGADEYLYTLGEDIIAEMDAYPSQWIATVDPVSGLPTSYLRQRYMIALYYGSPDPNPPALTVDVTDTLPVELSFEDQYHSPSMLFDQFDQTLTWQTSSPLPVNQTAQVLLYATAGNPEPGSILTNTAQVAAGAWRFDLQNAYEVPLFPPLLTTPGNGEICSSSETGGTQVIGMAQGNAVVKLYENGIQVLMTVAEPSGVFSTTYTSTRVGVDALTTLTAAACLPGNPSQCSALSDPVVLKPIQSFWCPQQSAWSVPAGGSYAGTYQFMNPDTGEFSTQNWAIVGPQHFPESTISLFLPDRGGQPSTPYITVDGGDPIYPTQPLPTLPPWEYNFPVPMRPYDILFWNPLDPLHPSEGGRLIDPDGYIFDVTQGFDPISPTLSIVEGVTVTAYVSMPQWGGWVPWPAHLYNNQVNPQVTGENGYFAFFTPPGFYYLQVEGIAGYQPWRSPLIEVISEIVHVNVPLTPVGQNSILPHITLTPDGPSQPIITITVGDTVEWVAEVDGTLPPQQRMAWLDNPMLRLLSDLDPLSNTLGWDGGMLAPGHIFRRQFSWPGTYTYTDGAGHTGTVVVTARVYLPLVKR